MFLLGILIFKRLTAWRLYKSFGVKGLNSEERPSCVQLVEDPVGTTAGLEAVQKGQTSAPVVCFPLHDSPSQSSLNHCGTLSRSESDIIWLPSCMRGESSVSDHTGLHPISLLSELEQLFSLISKTVCSRQKHMCNSNVHNLQGMAICITELLDFILWLLLRCWYVCTEQDREFSLCSISCVDGILEHRTQCAYCQQVF
jgi:hypothetical protein